MPANPPAQSSRLTPARLLSYLRRLSLLMGLEGWSLSLGDPLTNPPDEPSDLFPDSLAHVFIPYAQRRAEFRFSPEFLASNPDLARLRRVAVHELVHCLLEPIMVAARSGFHRLSAEASLVASDTTKDALESACDQIATAWAPALPLLGERSSQAPR